MYPLKDDMGAPNCLYLPLLAPLVNAASAPWGHKQKGLRNHKTFVVIGMVVALVVVIPMFMISSKIHMSTYIFDIYICIYTHNYCFEVR